MYLAKVSSIGQITIPADIRKLLDIQTGDRVLFVQDPSDNIIIKKAVLESFK